MRVGMRRSSDVSSATIQTRVRLPAHRSQPRSPLEQ
ncbi:hypothetical protein M3J09_001708 [Ascochyta lentis]